MTAKFPRIIVLLFGILTAVALVSAVELGLRIWAPAEVEGLRVEFVSTRKGMDDQSKLNWAGWALSGYSARYWYEEEFVTFSDVNFDVFGRRVVPHSDSRTRKKHLIFIGGSLTFGEGVSDGEALPAFYAENDLNSRAYNYGIPGAGPNQFAFQLKNDRFFSSEAVPERNGTLVYVFYNSYLARVQNSASLFMYWKDRPMPSYRVNERGKAEYEGEFREVHPWRTLIYTLIAKSAIYRFLRLDYPFLSDRYAYDMVAALIQNTKELYLQQFPNGRFVVVFYPEKARGARKRLLPKLKARDIEVFDYSKLERFPRDNPAYWIPHHEHPTAKMNRELSALLYKDLNIPRN